MGTRFWLASFLAATALAGACADFTRGPAADAATDAATELALVEDTVFENYIYPILQSDCHSCHSPGNEAGYGRFVLTGNAKADRAGVVALVYRDNADGSLLLQRATNSDGDHIGGRILTEDSPEYLTVRNWIATLPPTP